jgi:hypothetical protein
MSPGHAVRAIAPGHGTAVPRRHAETHVIRRKLHPTGRQCRGDPVGRPAGARAGAGTGRYVGRGARWHQGDAPRRPYMPRRTAR